MPTLCTKRKGWATREPYAQLQEYARKQTEIEVVAKHWDFTQHMDGIVRFVKRARNSFPFVFIDPKGYELACIDVIAPLLRLLPREVLINLMTSFIRRFIGDDIKPLHRIVGRVAHPLRSLQRVGERCCIHYSRTNLGRVATPFLLSFR